LFDCCRSIHHVSHQQRCHCEKEQQRCERETALQKGPVNRRVRLVGESRPQTEIKVWRCGDGAETSDYLSQLRLLLLKLTARRTLAQMFGSGSAARLIKHQLIEFSTNQFAIVFLHNFFTYK
jgi:hypothetical protein